MPRTNYLNKHSTLSCSLSLLLHAYLSTELKHLHNLKAPTLPPVIPHTSEPLKKITKSPHRQLFFFFLLNLEMIEKQNEPPRSSHSDKFRVRRRRRAHPGPMLSVSSVPGKLSTSRVQILHPYNPYSTSPPTAAAAAGECSRQGRLSWSRGRRRRAHSPLDLIRFIGRAQNEI